MIARYTFLNEKKFPQLLIHARDTDGYPITKTECTFKVALKRTDAGTSTFLTVERHPQNASLYTSSVLFVGAPAPGLYTLSVHLVNGWDTRAQMPKECAPQHLKAFFKFPIIDQTALMTGAHLARS